MGHMSLPEKYAQNITLEDCSQALLLRKYFPERGSNPRPLIVSTARA